MRPDPRLLRLGVSSAVALTTVLAAAFGGLGSGSDAAAPGNPVGSMHEVAGTLAAIHAAADHDENDLTVKNALSRSPEAALVTDPTTDAQRAASEAYVESERAMPDPQLTTATLGRPRLAVPEDRYAMAGGCYTLNGKPYLFQATDLGSYLLYTPDRKFLGVTLLGGVTRVDKPSTTTDWTVQRTSSGGFTFTLANGKALHRTLTGGLSTGTASAFPLARTTGCTAYPEVDVDISGGPFAGTSSFQEVRGYVDPHTHGMSHEFLGGRVICSPPWHRYGAPYALVDCPDHQVANGKGAVLDDFLAGRAPGTGHDPVGWPTFKDWPNPHSLTHQGVYWKWLERSWRGGLRVYTNLLVENNVLCELYPLKKNSCNDMESIRRQAKDMWKMQDYIDAQYGGPGRGWYRIVTDPFQARQVINSGKLAVIMGIETSVPFGCNVVAGQPTCSQQQLDAGLAEVKAMGVRQMEITNKFDNALTGVAGDEGTTGTITNLGNFINTGSFLQMRTCPSTYDEDEHDKLQGPLTAPEGALPQQDAIFGAIGELYGLGGTQPVPAYPPGPHCNARGLTDLGKRLLNEMIDNGILFDPDHMSVNGRNAALDLYEKAAADGRHPGILSSHSWSTPDAYPRIYKLGGFVTPYAGDSPGFVDKWRQHLGWADPRYYFGFGYGADMNGFGAQGSPRGANATNPVTYPFTGLGGVTVDKGVSGQRVWDINTDGVAQYGLYPDWIEDAAHVAGTEGVGFKEDMSRGAEAYLEMWERAVGIAPDACRNADQRRSVDAFRAAVSTGMTTRQVLDAVGQPYERLGHTYTTCATDRDGSAARMAVDFSAAGVVTGVRRVG
ncbi:hypothetical protein [Nocardioides jiangxiensis]|uniref:Membrane dipeptidase (Peptidase family M19) n=1 Tax=Nocardioides jiangxiensis TaxID=3064524 RepID=A0ABT9B0Q0_9ACTN|nr:hypothetical protein [Nocardioides sp. WY-20]MDO7868430.1 hypothetical protein [Nocardioides sp. WY-20]